MPLFEITPNGLDARAPVTFAELGLFEREDLQRYLREDITALGDDLLVVAEEYGNWEDARRRIDLLAVDKAGHIVVIELKRTDDGGHMDLQAVRYAAMVSSMQFDDLVTAFAAHLALHRPDADARTELETFLEGDQDEDGAPLISSDVRIVLVSMDFGRELTTTVLWLNRFEGMDIRCVRLVPYRLEDRMLLDIQQIVPLPEAEEYQVRLRRKEQQREHAGTGGRDFTRYRVVVDGQPLDEQNKRHTMRVMVEQLLARGAPAAQVAAVLGSRRLRSVEGRLYDQDAVVSAFRAADGRFDERRFFTEHPIHEGDRTWILSNQWGVRTEPMLRALRDQFPDTGVTFKRAGDSAS